MKSSEKLHDSKVGDDEERIEDILGIEKSGSFFKYKSDFKDYTSDELLLEIERLTHENLKLTHHRAKQ